MTSVEESNYVDGFNLDVRYPDGEQEPCILSYQCQYCQVGSSACQETEESLIENTFDLLNVTRYGSTLRYECALGREFLLSNNPVTTSPGQEMTCDWQGNWTPTEELGECICKLR
jgi:hypothetical protein